MVSEIISSDLDYSQQLIFRCKNAEFRGSVEDWPPWEKEKEWLNTKQINKSIIMNELINEWIDDGMGKQQKYIYE